MTNPAATAAALNANLAHARTALEVAMSARDTFIRSLRADGMALAAIGELFNLSHVQVRNIVEAGRAAEVAATKVAKARKEAKGARIAAAAAKPAKATTVLTSQKLAILDPNNTDHWSEVHAFGCADLNKTHRGTRRGLGAWTMTASTLTEAAAEIASDFLAEDEGSTVDDYLDNHIHFAPCVHLPRA